MPAHDAAGLQQSGRAQGRLADEEPRAEADAAGELVRLGRQRSADFDRGGADHDARARLEIEPREQRGVGGGAERAVALRQHRGERLRRIERDLAVERISGVHRLDLDQRRAPVISASRAMAAHAWRRAIRGPRRSRNARSSAPASRRLSENARSPPRMTRPSRASPSASPAATEPMPAIAITPSAMQAMNT